MPPSPAPDDTFELRAFGSVPLPFGRTVQSTLVSHNVASGLLGGLGVRPRNYPRRVPVFLRPGRDEGITAYICGDTSADAAVVATGGGARVTAGTAAHELVHVYSSAVKLSSVYPWFEDPLAEWFTWKVGLLEEPTSFEVYLQYPDHALDTLAPAGYRYGMWRFVQFLDDKGLMVAGDGSWPLARGAIAGAPASTATLDQILRSVGTSLGAELAEFWGQHLKERPARPPRLKTAPGSNSTEVRVTAGRRPLSVSAKALHTKLTDFKLAGDVKRVEFEFEPPADGYFWGLTAPDTSRRFRSGETVSFCVGGADEDDLAWPGHFAVTFTNGIVRNKDLSGKINVYAQENTDQCTSPAANRACRVLRESQAESLLGPTPPEGGGFRPGAGVERGRPYVLCTYIGEKGLGILNLERWRSSTELRRTLTRSGKQAGWKPVRLGDAAFFFLAPGGQHAFVNIAIGRELLSVNVSSDAGPGTLVMKLARAAVERVD